MLIEFVPPLEAGSIDAGGEVLKLAGGEVGAVLEASVGLESVPRYSGCSGGNTGEE